MDYENGFGNVKGEHWLGLKKISCLTSVKGKLSCESTLMILKAIPSISTMTILMWALQALNTDSLLEGTKLGDRSSRGQHDMKGWQQ